MIINIPTSSNTYPIDIGMDILHTQLMHYIQNNSQQRLVIITDSNLFDTLGKNLESYLLSEIIPVELLSFSAGEIHKTRETKQQLEDELFSKGYGRDTCLIALGGGVVSDLVGFLAATYCRGIACIYIPTTLLAMVDASIGGKTGVNTPLGKNLIGAFYQPKAVIMDIALLESLPEKEWHNGIVEMLKHGLIRDAELFDRLKNNAQCVQGIQKPEFLLKIIYESCVIKQKIVEQDECDKGIRQILNFGHTIGHAIETLEDYQLSHGEAVAMGMIVEAYLSALFGFLAMQVVEEIEKTLQLYGLILETKAFQNKALFKKAMGLDKKALNNTPYFVLLESIGKTCQQDAKQVFSVEPQVLEQALDWAKIRFQA